MEEQEKAGKKPSAKNKKKRESKIIYLFFFLKLQSENKKRFAAGITPSLSMSCFRKLIFVF